MAACTACVGMASKTEAPRAPPVFYTVTAEIALSRHEARIAALEYAAAIETGSDAALLRRAAEVTAACLQPSLTMEVADRWLAVDPGELDAHRAAGRAALELHLIDRSAAQYEIVVDTSPRGTDAEFAALEAELNDSDNSYGARQLADRLAYDFPASAAALRMQAFAALRADDPAAAVGAFQAALAAPAAALRPEHERRELTQGLLRARILAGDVDEPLAQAKNLLDAAGTAENRLDYALLLLAAQRDTAARMQLEVLRRDSEARPVALRLLGLVEFQDGRLDEASAAFAELAVTGKFLDEARYYLGLIAERHDDLERAVRLYAQVESGDDVVPALLRAAAILRAHAAAPAAEELMDQLMMDEPQRAPEILSARARLYADAGDTAQALALLNWGELQYPDSAELRYARASLSAEQGRIGDALRDLKKMAALRPADPAALNAYGYTLADNHRHLQAARRLIERAHAAAPRSAAISDSLGWVLFRQGRGEQALPYLHAAYADDRGSDIAAHLGEVLWTLGRQAEAERLWSQAADSGDDNRLLKATRLRLQGTNGDAAR